MLRVARARGVLKPVEATDPKSNVKGEKSQPVECNAP